MSESLPSARRPRPLSPHLQIYSPQLTSLTSILHRVTGVLLTIGLVLVSVMVFYAANDPNTFEGITAFFASPFGLTVLTGFVAAACYHFCAGIRHLIWDTGALLDLKAAYAAGYLMLGCSALLTILIMICILEQLGVIHV